MRFLILTQYFEPEVGAPQVRLGAMVRELIAQGHDVEVVTAVPNHPTGRIAPPYRGRLYLREELYGIPVHRVWLYAANGAGFRRILNYVSFSVTCLLGLVRSRRPDYVFVESPPLFLSVPGFIASRLWGAKMVFNVADLWPDSVRELGLMKNKALLRMADWLERWSYRVSDRVNAVTDGIRSTLVHSKEVPESKVVFMPNGVDTELFQPREPNLDLANKLGLVGKKIVVYAGTLGFAQGLETVLEAANLLRDHTEIHFVFIGDGSEKAKLVTMTQNMALRNVLFLDPAPPGYVADLYSIAMAGLAVLRDVPLFEGARPSKIFPIMASGVPVVYSGRGEGARLIEQAGAGITLPPESPQRLAEAVAELANSPELAEIKGKAGRSYVTQYLSWSALVHNWLEQLNSLGGK